MLSGLQIRNIVLIEALDIAFSEGLTVLTGETGAGKSIILDSLALAIGARGDKALIRQGTEQASVTATFDLPAEHAAHALLLSAGLEPPAAGEALILRRSLSATGASRAFINDAPVALALLRAVGDSLVEVHGQNEAHGLLDAAAHRALLDAFGGLEGEVAAVGRAFGALQAARGEAEAEAARVERAARERDYLEHAADELARLHPEAEEETLLAGERARLFAAAKAMEDLTAALEALHEEGGVAARIGTALRRLERGRTKGHEGAPGAAAALERALIELQDGEERLEAAIRAARADPSRLEAIEERLAALRDLARKHRVSPDALAAKQAEIDRLLQDIHEADDRLKTLNGAAAAAERAYLDLAATLGARRRAAAKALDAAVNGELQPLRLGKAVFTTRIEPLPPGRAGEGGLERAEFEVKTNEDMPAGPLGAIASGGELARFVLALKVVLARTASAATLIFDEIDQGVGGAVADAVGERLARLASPGQVLVVTHSPQVAARGHRHFKVTKTERSGRTRVSLEALTPPAREDEIARMLAGSEVTAEARAAARRLLEPPARAPKKKTVRG